MSRQQTQDFCQNDYSPEKRKENWKREKVSERKSPKRRSVLARRNSQALLKMPSQTDSLFSTEPVADALNSLDYVCDVGKFFSQGTDYYVHHVTSPVVALLPHVFQ